MDPTLLVVIAAAAIGLAFYAQRRSVAAQRELADAKAEGQRWVERLGGQVLNLTGTDEPSRQAIADASERYTAAGSQLEQARTTLQCRLVTQTALEGLYYVRAARTAMGMDPGPELPAVTGQAKAGAVTEQREVEVDGRDYAASPEPSGRTPHYYPGGMVAGRPVPQGWYSEPWWKPALVAGAWGVGSVLLFSAMFSGMHGVPAEVSSGAGELGDADGMGGMGDDTRFGDDFGDGDGGGFDGGFDF